MADILSFPGVERPCDVEAPCEGEDILRPSGAEIVSHMAPLLDRIKAGEIVAIAAAFVTKEGSTGNGYICPSPHDTDKLMAAIAYLQAGFATSQLYRDGPMPDLPTVS